MVTLPPDITFWNQPLPGGGWFYNFRHRTLGELGRILVRGVPGGTHISCEVSGDPADPRTRDRLAIFEPLGREIARQLETATGSRRPAISEPPPLPPDPPTELVESKLMQCRTCDAFVALLIFAPNATDAGRFEDYARLMYAEYARHNLPTWIIGPAFGPGPTDTVDIIKVWPTRKAILRLTPGQFNPRVARLARRHCR
ncbi:MAG: hypothetical protein P4L10_08415 [Acidobacteriaceae bacterium]|nr:hypothetical protein [Acidobacteriaceae bacterium]